MGNLNKMGKRQTGYALRIGCVSASLRSISLRLRQAFLALCFFVSRWPQDESFGLTGTANRILEVRTRQQNMGEYVRGWFPFMASRTVTALLSRWIREYEKRFFHPVATFHMKKYRRLSIIEPDGVAHKTDSTRAWVDAFHFPAQWIMKGCSMVSLAVTYHQQKEINNY